MTAKTVAVLGLGSTGRSTCRALADSGVRVWAWDDVHERRAAAAAAGVTIVDLNICNWARVDRLVLSPGVPLSHPRPHRLVRQARSHKVPVTGDLELMVENQPDRVIVGVTGTNGKSTTATLVTQILANAGKGVQLGGNIGLPVLDLLPKPVEDIYVLELSSYQLDLTEALHCTIAMILNVSPDHLDRHGGMAGYVRAKRRILSNQGENDWAVIGVDDDHGVQLHRQLSRAGGRSVLPVAVGRVVEQGIYVIDGRLYDALDATPSGAALPVLDLRSLPGLRGAHNWQNAAAAYGAARALGLEPAVVAAGIEEFAGLEHRMELVATVDGIQFVNDSKATNPEAAARALASFDEIYWIAGGRAKDATLDPILPSLERVRHAFLIGEAADSFDRTLAGRVEITRSGDLQVAFDQAVAAARAADARAPVVLLAPACASFDQFVSFEARGNAFKALVADLAATVEPAVAAAEAGG